MQQHCYIPEDIQTIGMSFSAGELKDGRVFTVMLKFRTQWMSISESEKEARKIMLCSGNRKHPNSAQ